MESNAIENVAVVVRVRPMNRNEIAKNETVCIRDHDSRKEVQIIGGPNRSYRCTCLPPNVDQEEFFYYCGITNLLEAAIAGYRACAFAFGQTGAGKTYTVVGQSNSISLGSPSDGLVGRSLAYLFDKLSRLHVMFTVRISCLEIYQESVYDLFVDERYRAALPIREHSTEGFFTEGSKLIVCSNLQDAAKVMDIAMSNRRIGEHALNARSNRSHCITDIYIDVDKKLDDSTTAHDIKVYGRLSIIDLAGSERLKSTRSSGKIVQETGHINKSLYVLGKVIAGLLRTNGDRSHRDVPYRDSKLTKLLIDSLGGNCKTLLVACVTEASGSLTESMRTLHFSMSCARIKNRPIHLIDPQDRLVVELKEEIKKLKQENTILRKTLLDTPTAAMLSPSLSVPTTTRFEEGDVNAKYLRSPRKQLDYVESVSSFDEQKMGTPISAMGIANMDVEQAGRGHSVDSSYGESEPSELGHGSGLAAARYQRESVASKPARLDDGFTDSRSYHDSSFSDKPVFLQGGGSKLVEITVNGERSESMQQGTSESKGSKKKQNTSEHLAAFKHLETEIHNTTSSSVEKDGLDGIAQPVKSKGPVYQLRYQVSKMKFAPVLRKGDSSAVRIKGSNTAAVKQQKLPSKIKITIPTVRSPTRDKMEGNIKDTVLPQGINYPIPSSSDSSMPNILDRTLSDDQQPNIAKGTNVSATNNKEREEVEAKVVKPSQFVEEFEIKARAKLQQVEKRLMQHRREMEDNPGDVTADTEDEMEKLEKQTKELRRELRMSAALREVSGHRLSSKPAAASSSSRPPDPNLAEVGSASTKQAELNVSLKPAEHGQLNIRSVNSLEQALNEENLSLRQQHWSGVADGLTSTETCPQIAGSVEVALLTHTNTEILHPIKSQWDKGEGRKNGSAISNETIDLIPNFSESLAHTEKCVNDYAETIAAPDSAMARYAVDSNLVPMVVAPAEVSEAAPVRKILHRGDHQSAEEVENTQKEDAADENFTQYLQPTNNNVMESTEETVTSDREPVGTQREDVVNENVTWPLQPTNNNKNAAATESTEETVNVDGEVALEEGRINDVAVESASHAPAIKDVIVSQSKQIGGYAEAASVNPGKVNSNLNEVTEAPEGESLDQRSSHSGITAADSVRVGPHQLNNAVPLPCSTGEQKSVICAAHMGKDLDEAISRLKQVIGADIDIFGMAVGGTARSPTEHVQQKRESPLFFGDLDADIVFDSRLSTAGSSPYMGLDIWDSDLSTISSASSLACSSSSAAVRCSISRTSMPAAFKGASTTQVGIQEPRPLAVHPLGGHVSQYPRHQQRLP